ncbi:MAG: chorismate lyase [Pseudomonadota bacterium]
MSSIDANSVDSGVAEQSASANRDPWSKTADVTGHAADWLLIDRLLTADIRVSFSGAKSLEVVIAGHAEAPGGAGVLIGSEDTRGWLREIKIRCEEDVLIHAVSFAPTATLNAQPWLATLGEAPLGDALDASGAVRRDPMYYCRSSAVSAPFSSDCEGWARQSIFDFGAAPLLLVEHLTPALLSTPRLNANDE